MAHFDDHEETRLRRRNDRVLLACAAVVVAMVGASFAAIPLYRIFCQATGFNGTTLTAKAAPGANGGPVFTIRFDANINDGLDWRFAPEQTAIKVRPGERGLAYFKAVSRAATPTTGSATYNVTPELAGQYFRKIQCFCFTEQTLAAGEVADMPVTFFVDPDILQDPDMKTVRTITLSYTFYPAAPAAQTQTQIQTKLRLGAAETTSPQSTN